MNHLHVNGIDFYRIKLQRANISPAQAALISRNGGALYDQVRCLQRIVLNCLAMWVMTSQRSTSKLITVLNVVVDLCKRARNAPMRYDVAQHVPSLPKARRAPSRYSQSLSRCRPSELEEGNTTGNSVAQQQKAQSVNPSRTEPKSLDSCRRATRRSVILDFVNGSQLLARLLGTGACPVMLN
jgi:hypothetical protein